MEPVVLSLRGEYDCSRQSELRKALEPAHEAEFVVLDLTSLEFLDSTCMCEFIRLRQARVNAGLHPACFVHDGDRLGRLFHFLELDEIFTVVHSLEEALGATPPAAPLAYA